MPCNNAACRRYTTIWAELDEQIQLWGVLHPSETSVEYMKWLGKTRLGREAADFVSADVGPAMRPSRMKKGKKKTKKRVFHDNDL